jgi:hypothetical protein
MDQSYRIRYDQKGCCAKKISNPFNWKRDNDDVKTLAHSGNGKKSVSQLRCCTQYGASRGACGLYCSDDIANAQFCICFTNVDLHIGQLLVGVKITCPAFLALERTRPLRLRMNSSRPPWHEDLLRRIRLRSNVKVRGRRLMLVDLERARAHSWSQRFHRP